VSAWSRASMLGVDYDSDDDEKLASAITAAPAAAAAAAPSKPAAAPAPVAKEQAKKLAKAARASLNEKKLREIMQEIASAKSATAVVKVIRAHAQASWDLRWAAEALYQVAKRSTARTRKEWADDPSIKKFAKQLIEATAASGSSLVKDRFDIVLLALDALRRMELQESAAQKETLEQVATGLAAEGWRRPVKLLARMLWLSAPLKLESKAADDSSSSPTSVLPAELKARSVELDGPDLAQLVSAMQNAGARDDGLVEKVVIRMRTSMATPEVLYKGLSATDLVEMAEGLKDFGVLDEAALRPLGQEVLRRRGELTPYESHRVHAAFENMKLPLPEVWMQPGNAQKRAGSEIVTTQAFAPQEGHEKKRRGNHDVERTSPPRVVRDYKMMSY